MNQQAIDTERLSPVVISAVELSKAYKVYSRPRDMLLEATLGGERHEKFWALRDVSLEIRQGEVVAFLGPNGSGKSTLLRILADKLDYTSGKVDVKGRVSALFELGTGFNMELTGRENVYQVGLYRGMTKQEIDRRFDDIVDFSELHSFIDQPLKTYSNGMKARLAFSAAIAIDPEILMIDEVLSVGDEAFSAKCSERMREICASGATILIVTHSTEYASRLCDRAYYMEHGGVIAEGAAVDICRIYDERMLARNAQRVAEEHRVEPDPRRVAHGAREQRIAVRSASEAAALSAVGIDLAEVPQADAYFENFHLESPDMPQPGLVVVGRPLRISYDIVCREAIPNAAIGLQITRKLDGICIASVTNSRALGEGFANENRPLFLQVGRNRITLDVPCFNVGKGTYTFGFGVAVINRSTWGAKPVAFQKDCLVLSVISYGERQLVACELQTDWHLNGERLTHEPPLGSNAGVPAAS